ncbi:MAG: magnesium and cobalt transport protein CorA [Rhodanobacteraceae bacterium]|nr:magnesium and cobalt transport protein CorA [Rhodanobacteraceae bacterium]
MAVPVSADARPLSTATSGPSSPGSPVVNCVAYANTGKRLYDTTLDQISDVLAEPDTFMWLGLHEPDESLLLKIQEEFGLHDLAIEDAQHAHQRPKIEVYDDTLFIVVHTSQFVDGKVQFGETHIFVGKRFLITVRHGASLSYARARASCEQTPEMLGFGPSFGLYAVLKRELVTLRLAVTPMHDILNQLQRFFPGLIHEEVRVYFRDVFDHAVRMSEATSTLGEMISAALQVNLAMVSVGQNEVTKRLAGWAAILAIPTTVGAIYGMNFENMPELSWAYGYHAAVSTPVAMCLALYLRLKKTGWL